MKVFLSNAPRPLLQRELKKNSVKKWIYFGTNDSVLRKLEDVFEARAEPVDYGEKLYQITRIKRNEFILWIDEVAASLLDHKEWLFSVSAVKNTYTSHLFLYTCYLFLLEGLIKEGKHIDLIFVDSPALAAIFEENFSAHVTAASMNRWLKAGLYVRILIKSILRFGKYLLTFGWQFVAAKIILKDRGLSLLKRKDNLIFIRNFMTSEFSDTSNDVVEKHYFPGLYDYLEKRNYTPAFLPVVTQASNYGDLYRKVSRGKKIIVFPEEFLKLQDYLYTFSAPLRALRLRLDPPAYGQYQLGKLLNEDYYFNLTEAGFLYATLLSCLGRRFKENGVTPRGMINWMENQALEKGLIKGFKEYFPDIQIIGSQPYFPPDNYFSTISSNQEKHSGLLPERILVLGPAGKKWATEFIKDIPVDYSPAFRYASVAGEPSMNHQGNSLLVLLSIRLENAISIARMLLNIEPQLRSFERIMIKPHPLGPDQKKLIKVLGRPLPQRFEFIDGKLDQYLDQVSIGLCGVSSTTVELVMRGIPVITIGEPRTLTMDYFSFKEDLDMRRICFSCDQVVNALNHFSRVRREKFSDLIQKAQEFRHLYIAKPSEAYWENYLVTSTIRQ